AEEAVDLKDRLGLERERHDVEHHACGDDHADQIEPTPDPALQSRPESIEARVPRAAERALLLADGNELSAARADHRALGLAHDDAAYGTRVPQATERRGNATRARAQEVSHCPT